MNKALSNSNFKQRVDENVEITSDDGNCKYLSQNGVPLKFTLVTGSMNGTSSPVGTKGRLYWHGGLPYFEADKS